MKKLLLLLGLLLIGNTLSAQVSTIVAQTWYLRNIKIDGSWHYLPLGEDIQLQFAGNNPDFTFGTNGVENTFTAQANFVNDAISLSGVQVSSSICTLENCDFEELYFYQVLSNQNLDDKSFTYFFQELSSGRKIFRITDANGNQALFSDQPLPAIDPALFQTWYLHYMEADNGDIDFISDYNPPISPTLTINPDLSFSGIGSCNNYMGNFNYSEEASNGVLLIPNDFDSTLGLCDFHNDFEVYYFSQLENGSLLYYTVGEDPNTGEGFFAFEKAPGFVFYYYNYPVLSIPDSEKNIVTLYPNPVDEKLFIKNNVADFEFSVVDINGRVVIGKSTASNEIDVSILKPGMYFITIESYEGNITKKFIKN